MSVQEITCFKAYDVRGRVPDQLNEEIAYIVDMGVDLRLNNPINSMKELLNEGYDAIFVGTMQ